MSAMNKKNINFYFQYLASQMMTSLNAYFGLGHRIIKLNLLLWMPFLSLLSLPCYSLLTAMHVITWNFPSIQWTHPVMISITFVQIPVNHTTRWNCKTYHKWRLLYVLFTHIILHLIASAINFHNFVCCALSSWANTKKNKIKKKLRKFFSATFCYCCCYERTFKVFAVKESWFW